jgi:hypothetical protein
MNRSIDVLFWNACPPASDLNPAQERCQNAPCMFIFSDEVLVIEIKGVYPIESLSRACQLSQTKVLFHVFFQCSSQFIQGFFGATLHCHIQVLGLEIDQRPGQGAIGRNV